MVIHNWIDQQKKEEIHFSLIFHTIQLFKTCQVRCISGRSNRVKTVLTFHESLKVRPVTEQAPAPFKKINNSLSVYSLGLLLLCVLQLNIFYF